MATSNSYDYIIVGAGSAGCVLANRLSADRHASVLLLEAGPRDWNPIYRVPVMAGLLRNWKYNNWSYLTEPEPHLNNRRIAWPRGKVLGGSSAINGMIYARGNRLDYDTWAQMGLTAWSYDRVLPYFRKSERYYTGENAFHGGEGPLPVTRMDTGHPIIDTFYAAGQQAGHKLNPDYNGEDQEGLSRYDMTIGGGERWSAARAFLGPIRHRPNLTIVTTAHLERIVIEGGRATGIYVQIGAERRHYVASREVILCCGTINSPMALMHSGIGDGEHLRSLGIPVVHELKGVGRNLQDHLNISLFYATETPDLFYDFARLDRAAMGFARAMLFKSGRATLFGLEGAAFLKTDPAAAAPEVQIHFMASGLHSLKARIPFARKAAGSGYGFTGHVCGLRPESRGEIRLRSANPAEAPIIRANYLSTEYDRRVMREGFRITENIVNQPAFDGVRGPRLTPAGNPTTDAEIDDWIAGAGTTIYHPVGTCRMGNDPMAVVDERLRVHGIEGLRVIDASIMPRLVSANTHAPTVMIAERAADFILGREEALEAARAA